MSATAHSPVFPSRPAVSLPRRHAARIACGFRPSIRAASAVLSRQFVVRVPPEVHRQLVLDAAEQHVSLNRLVSSRLAS
jgi:hypothetical protein